jgi:ABC-type branched-subunit amino acid transport system ATPase component
MKMNNGLMLRNISKRFGGSWALRDIRASVAAGKITAFIGPNGAGKTTLLHVIGGTLKPDQGDVEFAGRKITGMPPYAVARIGIGRLFQDVRVFGGLTALQNVAVAALPVSSHRSSVGWYGPVRKSMRRAQDEAYRWLEYVGLSGERDVLAKDLSFGQQKLIGLARLFAQRPVLLLLDEPTAGLSHSMLERVTSLIERAVADQGLTVILVEHNMSVVTRLAFWIHFVHEGSVAFSGETRHVLGNKSVREIYMGLL